MSTNILKVLKVRETVPSAHDEIRFTLDGIQCVLSRYPKPESPEWLKRLNRDFAISHGCKPHIHDLDIRTRGRFAAAYRFNIQIMRWPHTWALKGAWDAIGYGHLRSAGTLLKAFMKPKPRRPKKKG